MAVEKTTKTRVVCDRCGRYVEWDESIRPDEMREWGEVDLKTKGQTTEYQLCPVCVYALKDLFIK